MQYDYKLLGRWKQVVARSFLNLIQILIIRAQLQHSTYRNENVFQVQYMFLNLLHKSLFFILTPFPPSLRNLMINGYKRGSGRGKVSVMVIFSRGEPPLVTCRQPGSGTPADVGKMSNQAGCWEQCCVVLHRFHKQLYNHGEGPYQTTRAFSWLKVPTSAFTFKTLLRHYVKQALTSR